MFLLELKKKLEKIKIVDFGKAIEILIDQPQPDEDLTKTNIGTLEYNSPEITEKKPYCYKTDVYSAGCVIFELIYLKRYADFTDVNIKSDDAKVKREINKRFVLLLRK